MSSSSPHLTIVYRTLDALTPDPRNARTHPRRQVDQIAAAIRAFGFTNPILIDPDGEIIAGHGRLLAAKAVGMSEVPTITLPDLTEAQKRALRLADNKIALGAGWDLDLLKVELADLASLDLSFDLTLTGFSTGEIDVLLNGGDNGDDDPFPTDAAFCSFLADTLGAAAAVSRDGAVHFVCMDWRHMDQLSDVGKQIYGGLLNLCVWNKSNAGMGSLYRSKHELVFVYKVGSAAHFNAVELGRHGRNRANVWDYQSVNSLSGSRREELGFHPTVKPAALVADAIQDVTRRGDLVLDVFLGSGTTLIAAERTGRRCRGVDIDPVYVDVALERWSALTGKEPVRLEGSA